MSNQHFEEWLWCLQSQHNRAFIALDWDWQLTGWYPPLPLFMPPSVLPTVLRGSNGDLWLIKVNSACSQKPLRTCLSGGCKNYQRHYSIISRRWLINIDESLPMPANASPPGSFIKLTRIPTGAFQTATINTRQQVSFNAITHSCDFFFPITIAYHLKGNQFVPGVLTCRDAPVTCCPAISPTSSIARANRPVV